MARALRQERNLAAALEVLLVEAVHEERHPARCRPRRRAIRSFGKRTGTPVVIMCTRLAMIENVWLHVWRANLGVEAVVVEREDRVRDGHAVQQDREVRGLGGARRSGRSGGGPTEGRCRAQGR